MHNRFFVVFAGFFALGFVLRPNPVWALVFYLGVLPLLIARIRRCGFGPVSPGVWAALGVCVWFGLSLLWGIDQTAGRIQKYAIAAVANAALVAAAYTFFRDAAAADLERFDRWIAAAAAVNVLLALGFYLAAVDPRYFHSLDRFTTRLEGWAETRHAILGADVLITAFVFAARAWSHAETDRRRAIAGACLVLVPVFVLLSGSRGPALALAAAAACLFLWQRRTLWILAAVGVALAAAYAFVPAFTGFVDGNLARKPYRFEIWAATLDYVRNRPWIGHGVASQQVFAEQFTFPHSMYMSALFYGGAIGLALLLACLGYAGWRAVRLEGPVRAQALALLAVPVVAGLTDIGQPIKAPSEEWYIVWLPIVAVLGLAARARIAGKAKGAALPPGSPRPASAAADQSARRPK